MKTQLPVAAFLAILVAAVQPLTASAAGPKAATGTKPSTGTVTEDWKGAMPDREFGVGLMAGAGLIEPKYGVALQGQVSRSILKDGWLDDVSDQVFLELSAGPTFVDGHSPFVFSTQLRWDFQKDTKWTFYALGGLGAQITGRELGDRSLIHLRFGAGAFYYLQHNMSLRMEASHEFLGGGLAFDF
jgi:hypothetical protein